MMKVQQVAVLGADVGIQRIHEDSYISLTDIARYKNPNEPKDVIKNWLRTRNTIDFLGLWEAINNPNFKGVEFDAFKAESGTNAFTLSPQKWIETTHAVGIVSKSGKNGGTFAHKDIAIKFANWISVEFELYLIREFQRLKEQEAMSLDWNVKRFLTKINYKIHTDAIKEQLIPKTLSKNEIGYTYADEADILNKALFGMTAKEWREANIGKPGNIRDDATIEQLIVLGNIESLNAEFIKMDMKKQQRLELLNKTAISQIQSLLQSGSSEKLLDISQTF